MTRAEQADRERQARAERVLLVEVLRGRAADRRVAGKRAQLVDEPLRRRRRGRARPTRPAPPRRRRRAAAARARARRRAARAPPPRTRGAAASPVDDRVGGRDDASAGKSCRSAVSTTRELALAGSTDASTPVKRIERNGRPSTTSSAVAAIATGHGRRISACASRYQPPCSPARRALRRPPPARAARARSRAARAGRRAPAAPSARSAPRAARRARRRSPSSAGTRAGRRPASRSRRRP